MAHSVCIGEGATTGAEAGRTEREEQEDRERDEKISGELEREGGRIV